MYRLQGGPSVHAERTTGGDGDHDWILGHQKPTTISALCTYSRRFSTVITWIEI